MGVGNEHTSLFRMIHIDNVPHILEHGITHRQSDNANPEYVQIGDASLIVVRSTLTVEVNNGDLLSDNFPVICLGDFIPFYFGFKMPMLYVMQKGGNFVARATNPEDIIYLVSSVERVIEEEVPFYFSDIHPVDGDLVGIYDSDQVSSLLDIIDVDAIQAEYWGGDENIDLKRKKQAEFLVANDLTVKVIRGYVCFNAAAKSRLLDMGISEKLIAVRPNYYF